MNISVIHHVTLLIDDEEQAAWFYGEVLGLPEKPRPSFKFPGLFYHCGNQEIHQILTSRPLTSEDLNIQVDESAEITRRHIHRHAAFLVSELDELEERLDEHGIEILFGPNHHGTEDELSRNMIESWMKMYSGIPIFVNDPTGNLIEFVPG